MTSIGSHNNDGRSLRVRLIASAAETYNKIADILRTIDDPPVSIVDPEPGTFTPANADNQIDAIFVVPEAVERLDLPDLEAVSNQPRPTIVVLLGERETGAVRRAIRAGADEVMFLPLDQNDAIRTLLKISEARRRAERSRARGRIISLTSVTGGVGVTTLTASLALAMNQLCEKRIGVVDLDLQTAGLGVLLNLEPDNTIYTLTQQAGSIDSIQLEAALTRHASGVYLLAAPKGIEESEAVTESTVAVVLDLMRELFELVIVDCGKFVNGNSLTVWERSDELIYVLDQSINSTRCAARFIELIEKLRLEVKPGFVLNRFDVKKPINEELVAKTLMRPLLAKIVRDDKLVERMQLTEDDPWQAMVRAPMARGVEELAGKLTASAATQALRGRSGLVSNLLKVIGGRTHSNGHEAH